MRTKSDFLSFLVVFLVTLGHELLDCFAQSGLPCTQGAELDTQSGQTCPILYRVGASSLEKVLKIDPKHMFDAKMRPECIFCCLFSKFGDFWKPRISRNGAKIMKNVEKIQAKKSCVFKRVHLCISNDFDLQHRLNNYVFLQLFWKLKFVKILLSSR